MARGGGDASRLVAGRAWNQRLARFAAAGQTVAGFCAAEGVSVAAFYYQRRKRMAAIQRGSTARHPNSRAASKPSARAEVPQLFRQVQVTSAALVNPVLTVRLTCGTKFTCPAQPGIVEQVLAQLLAASQAAAGGPRC